MISHYFIVTPLNYLCAQEYKFKHPEGKHHLYVVSNYEPTNEQHRQIISDKDWDKVIWICNGILYTGFVGKILDIFYKKHYLNKYLNKITKEDSIIIGNFGNNWCKYVAQKSKSKIVLIDDGFASIDYFNQYLKQNFIYNKKLLSKFEIFVYGLNRHFLYNLNFFSSFKFPMLNKNIENHRFESLKSCPTKVQYQDSFYFLGGPYIRLKILEKEQYISIINSIFEDFTQKGIQCYYIPHRTEDVSIYSWNIIQNDLPFELYFASLQEKPKHMGSFFSTAVYNANLMDPNNIQYYFYNVKNSFTSEKRVDLFNYIESLNCFTILEIE